MPVKSALPPVRTVGRPPSSLDRLATLARPHRTQGDAPPGAAAGPTRRHQSMDDGDKKPNPLLQGAGTLLGLLGQAIEHGQAELSRTVEIPIGGSEQPGTGVFGVRMRVGTGEDQPGGSPVRSRPAQPAAAAREPLVDLFDEGEEIVIAAETPGAGDDDVTIEIEGDVLSLTVRGAGGFAKAITLPHPVDAQQIRKTCKNGLLEVRLTKRSAQDD